MTKQKSPFLNKRAGLFSSFITNLPRLCFIIAGLIIGLMLVRLYHLTEKNLVLQNYLLENEINDYVASKLELRK